MNDQMIASHIDAKTTVTGEDLRSLARFLDPRAQAVSFYFHLPSFADNSHREEIALMKNMVRDVAYEFPASSKNSGIHRDLESLRAVTEELREGPSRLTAIFACHEQKFRQEFHLPALTTVIRLEAGPHFSLAPLLRAVESCAPYAVVLLENGKVRGFVVQGAGIEEINGFFAHEPMAHEGNVRTGWSHHIEGNELEKSRAWARELAPEIRRFLALRRCTRAIIGCRDDLWGEFGPYLGNELRSVVAGIFHAPTFEISPAEVLRLASPLFARELRARRDELLNEIRENPLRRVVGGDQAAIRLQEGRIRKMLVGMRADRMLDECAACGHLQPQSAGSACVLCTNTGLRPGSAQEALIRQALLTDTEIFVVPEDIMDEFDGVAGLLRY
jgi:hypothetical protein